MEDLAVAPEEFMSRFVLVGSKGSLTCNNNDTDCKQNGDAMANLVIVLQNAVVPAFGREGAPKDASCDGTKPATAVALIGAELASAGLQGDEALLASLRGIGHGGARSAEWRRIAFLWKHDGVGANVSAVIERYPKRNDSSNTTLPNVLTDLYVVSDSALKLRAKKTRAGNDFDGGVSGYMHRTEQLEHRCRR